MLNTLCREIECGVVTLGNSIADEEAPTETDGPKYHAEDQNRLRSRLAKGPDALLDHELIGYLLTLGNPRDDTRSLIDTGPLAQALLRDFGGIGGVLTAQWDRLMRFPGMGDARTGALKVVQAAALRLLSVQAMRGPLLSNWQALLDYLRADMAHLKVERVRVLHLNARNMLIRDDHMGDGSIDHTAIYSREVIRRAIDLGSASLILVHNHPSGSPRPSAQDVEVTRQLTAAGRLLGINVHDHIIIGSEGYTSIRNLGLL